MAKQAGTSMGAQPSDPSETKDEGEDLAVFRDREGRQIKNVKLDKLFFGELNERLDPGDLEGLARSIKQVGVLEPILVRPVGERFEIIAGGRRYRAAGMVSLGSVPCQIKELDDVQALQASFQENEERKSASPLEYGLLCWKLATRSESLKEVADLLGKTQAWVESRINAYELYRKAHVLAMEKTFNGELASIDPSSPPALGLVDANMIMQAVTSRPVNRYLAQTGGSIEDERTRVVKELSAAFPKLGPRQKRKLVSEFKRNPRQSVYELTQKIIEEPPGIKVSISFNAEISARLSRMLDRKGERLEQWLRRIAVEELEREEHEMVTKGV
jgi:ParB/RepB/Spo0J family partition protein